MFFVQKCLSRHRYRGASAIKCCWHGFKALKSIMLQPNLASAVLLCNKIRHKCLCYKELGGVLPTVECGSTVQVCLRMQWRASWTSCLTEPGSKFLFLAVNRAERQADAFKQSLISGIRPQPVKPPIALDVDQKA